MITFIASNSSPIAASLIGGGDCGRKTERLNLHFARQAKTAPAELAELVPELSALRLGRSLCHKQPADYPHPTTASAATSRP